MRHGIACPAPATRAATITRQPRCRARRWPPGSPGSPAWPSPGPTLKQAAVAVCVTEAAGTPSLLLTRRAAGLRSHPGQWALPGGRREAGESAVQAALRELAEEVGLHLGSEAVLGVLDDYVTRSGYVMTPVVCWAGPAGAQAARAPRSPRSTTSRCPTSTSSRG